MFCNAVVGLRFKILNNEKPKKDGRTPIRMQCCGSGTVGSMFLGLLDPDPFVRGSRPFYHQTKIIRKSLIPSVFLRILFDFLSLKNYVNVPLNSTVLEISRKVKKNF